MKLYPFDQPDKPAVADSSLVALANESKEDPYAWKIVWKNVLFFVYLHYAAVRGIYLLSTGQCLISTFVWGLLLGWASGIGVTGGSHRLWAHRSYQAKWPLRVLLMLQHTIAAEKDIYDWSRDHRVHHKFTDTDADPHNINRGFFFSHMGWLMIRKHPDVITKGAGVDLSDLERDSIVMFQRKHYKVLVLLIAYALPVVVPVMLWGESAWTAWYVCAMLRSAIVVHITWCINSVAHSFGTRPIEKSISPRENATMAHIAFGEGWHNYHHVFPWDYKAGELGNFSGNVTAAYINFFARIGWAYDLKTASAEMVNRRMRRTGDGTHPRALTTPEGPDSPFHQHDHDVWGWGDKDMTQEDLLGASVRNRTTLAG